MAIETCSEVARWLGDGDPTSRHPVEQILEQEEEHADDLAGLLENFVARRARSFRPGAASRRPGAR
ncbi:MAG: hypothetical protein ACQEXJ_21895 [Myxococcota bacterium]